MSTNGVVHGWSADRKQSTSAVTTTVNFLLSNAPPFLPFFASAQSYASSDSTPIASESTSQNDLKCFANTGVNSLQTPCSSTRIRDVHKPSGACGCPPSCASRLKSQLASQRLFAPPLILLVWGNGTSSQQSNNPTRVLQYLFSVLSDFRTQFVPGLCPQEQCRADHPSNTKEIHAKRKRDTSGEATWTRCLGVQMARTRR